MPSAQRCVVRACILSLTVILSTEIEAQDSHSRLSYYIGKPIEVAIKAYGKGFKRDTAARGGAYVWTLVGTQRLFALDTGPPAQVAGIALGAPPKIIDYDVPTTCTIRLVPDVDGKATSGTYDEKRCGKVVASPELWRGRKRSYEQEAHDGEPNAMYMMGLRHARGQGIQRDERKAVDWYRQAAEAGQVQAQVLLGARYSKGRGVPRDEALAIRWYEAAALQGSTRAQYQLGQLYFQGQDKVRAYAWLSLAMKGGEDRAIEPRSQLLDTMTPGETQKAQELRLRLLAAQQPNR